MFRCGHLRDDNIYLMGGRERCRACHLNYKKRWWQALPLEAREDIKWIRKLKETAS